MKLTKKLLSLLLALAVICPSATLGIVTASAANAGASPTAASPLTVRANSNYAPTFEKSFDADTDQITVTWWIQAQAFEMVDFEGTVTYDTSKLAVDMTPGVNTDPSGTDVTILKPFSEGTLGNLNAPQKRIDSLDKLPNESSNNGIIRITAYQESGASLISGNGGAMPLLSVTFTPVAGASGATDVNFYAGESLVRSTDGTNTESIFYSLGQRPNNNLQYLPEHPVAIKEKAGTGAHFQSVTAVGNGDAEWLNGANWNPAAQVNRLTETEDGIWQITYSGVREGFDRMMEFSVDEGGTVIPGQDIKGNYTFGKSNDSAAPAFAAGEWFDACWDGGNICFDTEDTCDVVVTLDLTGFDFPSKTGAKYKIDIIYNNYVVVGNVTEIFRAYHDAGSSYNTMMWQEGYTYSKTYTVNRTFQDVAVKVAEKDNFYSDEWFGDERGNSVIFDITKAGTFTVRFNALTRVVSVSGNCVAFKDTMDYQYISVVGNGEGNWLSGQYWVPQAEKNKMNRIADDVWQITCADVEDGFNRMFGFSVDSRGECAAPMNTSGYLRGDFTFGLPKNSTVSEVESGVWYDACWDGDNIALDIYDTSDVTLTLDLTNFDFKTKTGAKFKVEICENNYLVAGNYSEIFGTYFDKTNHNNDMQWDEDNYYVNDNLIVVSKTYTVNKPYTDVAVRVIKNEQIQFGDAGGHNLLFDVTKPGSFTVSFDTIRHVLFVTGDNVVFKNTLAYSYISVVGNGEGNWLLGQYWIPQAEENKMKQIANGVWQITYADVEDGFNRLFGFSVDGRGECIAPFNTSGYLRGDFTFGLPKNSAVSEVESGVWYDAGWDGDNIALDIYDISDVTLTLDLSNFDFTTKTGAKFKVEICENNYLVAGNNYEIFGAYFDNTNHNNDMQWDEDAFDETGNEFVFSKTYTVNRAYNDVAVRVVKNEQEQFGDAGGHNLLFDITQPGSFTVSFDTIRHIVSVTGEHVVFRDALAYSSVSVAGNGEGNWLLGQYWNPKAKESEMKEIEEGVWQISYANVEDGFNRLFGFSVDGRGECLAPYNTSGYLRGDFTFGRPKNGAAPEIESGVWYDACWDGDNIAFDTEDICTVILTLDLRSFDYRSKTGAKYKVDIIENTTMALGDVNRDGSFSAKDITLLQQYLAEFVTLDGNALANADVTCDGKFNVKDVTKMQRVLAELETFYTNS